MACASYGEESDFYALTYTFAHQDIQGNRWLTESKPFLVIVSSLDVWLFDFAQHMV